MSAQRESEGGDGRPRSHSGGTPAIVRHEEELDVEMRCERVGRLGVRREVETRTARERYPRQVEELAQERVPVGEGDSGEVEVLPDGSVSIPLFEEELVVTRRQVLRERVVIRKDVVTEWETVEAELRREHVAFETDDAA